MKALILMLLLIPGVFAEDVILEAKQAALDANAYEFLQQMNITIDFASEKNISAENLEQLKEQFMEKNKEAIEAKKKEEFEKAVSEMKNISESFKQEAKINLTEFLDELKYAIKEGIKREFLDEKKENAEEKKKLATLASLKLRLEKIESYVLQKKEATGKEPTTYVILMERFQREIEMVNSTGLEQYEVPEVAKGVSNAFSNIGDKLSSISEFFKKSVKKMGAE